ncbi:phosphotransferase [Oceanobacillus polygoni]|uniref:Thiamine kinase-like enzyme n=1 Tax=Oceanobacillus polygoni TaxID=1235259 RepID=A0A9X0YXQ5_9BACI|nr:phosphotransferase [Oceanobacillus polygoni]MBP2079115.1 thiamine kinase-like enzyme [Oceanobacillus polygoni]
MDNINNILRAHYNIGVINKSSQQGGWASLAYKLDDGKNAYFLKVYEKQRASTPKLTALIDQYTPILMWLKEHSNLKTHIIVPILTKQKEYTCEDENNIYMLYDYIDGGTIGNQSLADNQIKQFSQIISELHLYGEDIPIKTDAIKEDFDVAFLEQLQDTVSDRNNFMFDVWQLIRPYVKTLEEMTIHVKRLAKQLKVANLRMSLCHTDLHYWNLMQSDHLMLIDWEGLKLAPVEADLMFVVDKAYFNEFLTIYQKSHPNFSINSNALKFYQEKRKLEDIWEFIEQLLYDKQEEHERVTTIDYLVDELKSIGE